MLIFIRVGLKVKALQRLIRDVIGVKVEGVKVYNMYIYLEEKNEGQTAQVVRSIPIGGRDILVIGDFNRSFMQNRGKAQRLIKFNKWALELNVLNDVKILTRGNATLDFVFSSVLRATRGLNEIQSGLDYGVIQVWTVLFNRKLFKIRIKVNVKKYKEQQT